MSEEDKPGFLCHFDALEDPRIDRKKLYPLTEILFVVICASICGAQSWRDFVTFGEEKLDYLRRFLPFENGIPSKNTYGRNLKTVIMLESRVSSGGAYRNRAALFYQ